MEPPDDLPDSDYVDSDQAPAAPRRLQQSTLPRPVVDYLADLNPAQREAVLAPVEGGTQLLAGPGSGKTAVLTRRVANLIQNQGIEPERLVVVTFTNKAANEMKVRLSKIIGAKETDRVVMGTFHSVCVRYLRKYAKLVDLASTFTIADRDDCLAMIKRVVSSIDVPDALKKELKPPVYLDHISKCKARMITPDELRASKTGQWDQSKFEWIARVFEAYDDELSKANSLDFDDLLLKGHELFSNHPRVVARIQSVLIDEFQDTNTVQYDLVKLIAKASGSLTIVGDPDQSIYGWRNAEVENLEKMVKDFSPCRQIFLEQNYRSTGAILGAALAVVRQDTKRINKSLHSSHPAGSSVVLHPSADPQTEATFISSTIKHVVAHMGGLVTYSDFAILLRYGALSRAIEVGLQKAQIPSKMVGGHKFFERAEVKDILSYLQLLSNPSYSPALQRILNVPRRALGDKAAKSIFDHAAARGSSPFEVCVEAAKGGAGAVSFGAAQKKAIKGLVEIIRDGRKKADEGYDVATLIDFITERTSYRAYLEKTQGTDAAEKWENVEELKSYAALVAEENPSEVELQTEEAELEEVEIAGAKMRESDQVDPVKEEDGSEFGEEEFKMPLASQSATSGQTTPLEVFLATSMLATDTETQAAKANGNTDKVTISTCHAAKGLEFPIVFIPACEDGTYPFFRATGMNEIDEERRLLYVAITRAQSFCFISYTSSRMAGGQFQKKSLSPFLTTVSQTYPTLFVNKLQKVSKKTREEMAKVLGRTAPDEGEAKQRIERLALEPAIPEPLTATRNYGSSFGKLSGQGGFTNTGRWSTPSSRPVVQSQPVPAGGGGFQSARGMLGQNNFGVFGGGKLPPSTSVPQASASTSNTSAPSGKPASAFRPLRPVAPGTATATNPSSLPLSAPPRYLAPRDQPNGIPSLPPLPKTRPATSGPPPTIETRASMIRDAVLVNPKLTTPTVNPSTQRDLLSSFQSAESKLLDTLKGLGGGGAGSARFESTPNRAAQRQELDLTLSSDDLPTPDKFMDTSTGTTKRPPMSPQRPAKKSKK
ncbi:hypothetical protein JCM11491_003209 [Sporobolomyces phaffii]